MVLLGDVVGWCCWVMLLGGVVGWVLLDGVVGWCFWVVLLDGVIKWCCWMVLLGCVVRHCYHYLFIFFKDVIFIYLFIHSYFILFENFFFPFS